MHETLFSSICMHCFVCVREGEDGVLRCKVKYVFVTVGHNQLVLKVTDLEHTNSSKQRVIVNGILRTKRGNLCVAVKDDFREAVWEWNVGLRG